MTFSSAHVAETAFYDAFQSADLEAMMRVWHPDEAVCIHPFGRRIEGHDAVRRSWGEIFSQPTALRFSLSHTRRFESDGLAVHLLFENITVNQDNSLSRSTVLEDGASPRIAGAPRCPRQRRCPGARTLTGHDVTQKFNNLIIKQYDYIIISEITS